MSAKENQTPQEPTGFENKDRKAAKTAREAQQRKQERRTNLLYGTIAVVFVLVAIVTFTWKSGIVTRVMAANATAATVNGEEYSPAEVQYYYTSVYQSFMNQYGSYASMFGLDTSTSLKSQECSMLEDGGTWFDYFVEQGLTQMADIHSLCAKADADGFTWNDEMQADFDESMASLEETVSTYNTTYNASVDAEGYLKLLYGDVMSRDVYEAQMKLGIQAQAYANRFIESLDYSESDLQAAYDEDPNSYDRVDYESVQISGAAESTTDADGNTVEPTEEESAAALETARKAAEAMQESYWAGESLSALADGDENATYTDGEAGAYSDTVLLNWLFDSARESGDTAVLADEDNACYYVVVFGERYRYDYNTVNVRHILIQPESGTLAEGDEGYEDEQAQLKADAQAKAEDILAQWQSGEATEDSFAALANENSSDGGSNTNGGLYEQVYKGQMVDTFNDWCFDAARKTGDTGIVETDYGYHIMYFVGTDLPYWQVQVTSTLSNNDYSAWYEEQTADAAYEANDSGLRYVG